MLKLPKNETRRIVIEYDNWRYTSDASASMDEKCGRVRRDRL